MAKIIMVNRKYLTISLSALLFFAIVFTAFSLWQKNNTSVSNTTVAPEIKMLSITLDPASITKDITYGSVTLKDVKVIPATNFNLTAALQNNTTKKMTNIPVELSISLTGDETQKVTKSGIIQVIEPGAAARVTFHGIKALGDSMGKNATLGQHNISIRIKANPQGGVNQATEANYQFVVDSTAGKN